jgi:hypothetical protein
VSRIKTGVAAIDPTHDSTEISIIRQNRGFIFNLIF